MAERGICKWFNNAKGYGFLILDDGSNREAFVHFSAIQAEGYRKLTEGDVVEFDVTKGEKGLKAENVVVLEHAED
jgi:CspA family cold shock protein